MAFQEQWQSPINCTRKLHEALHAAFNSTCAVAIDLVRSNKQHKAALAKLQKHREEEVQAMQAQGPAPCCCAGVQ